MLAFKDKQTGNFFQSEYHFPDEGSYSLVDNPKQGNRYSLPNLKKMQEFVTNFPSWEIAVVEDTLFEGTFLEGLTTEDLDELSE